MNNSYIGWCTRTQNPALGCTAISEACDFCYARILSIALKSEHNFSLYAEEFKVREVPSRLNEPKKYLEPELVFLGSMTDLLHFEQQGDYRLSDGRVIPGGRIRPEYFAQVLDVCRDTPQHEYMLPTKRPHQFLKYAHLFDVPNNVSFGATVEANKWLIRIESLRQIPSKYRFLSIEPLLEDLTDLKHFIKHIDFVIVGGESYDRAAATREEQALRDRRFMRPEWVLRIRDLCEEHGKPFFFKQWGHIKGAKPQPILPELPLQEYLDLFEALKKRGIREHEMPWEFSRNPKAWRARTYFELPEPLLTILRRRKPWMFKA